MRNLFMLILSVVTGALLAGTLYAFFVHLRRIQDAFWGREKETVAGKQANEAPTGPLDEDTDA